MRLNEVGRSEMNPPNYKNEYINELVTKKKQTLCYH